MNQKLQTAWRSWKRGTPCCIVWAHSWTMACPAASWSPVCTWSPNLAIFVAISAICAMIFPRPETSALPHTMPSYATYVSAEAQQGCSLCPVGHLSRNLEAPTPQQKHQTTSTSTGFHQKRWRIQRSAITAGTGTQTNSKWSKAPNLHHRCNFSRHLLVGWRPLHWCPIGWVCSGLPHPDRFDLDCSALEIRPSIRIEHFFRLRLGGFFKGFW